MESLSSTTKVGTVSNIIQYLRVGVENGVQEANRALSDGRSVLVELLFMLVPIHSY